MTYHVAEAYEFYRACLLSPLEAKAPHFEERNIKMEGVIHHRDWEVFIAILVDDVGNPEPYGADLTRHEVKSAGIAPSLNRWPAGRWHNGWMRRRLMPTCERLSVACEGFFWRTRKNCRC